MNILFANNHNYIRGGAEKVYFDEMDLLSQNGHSVTPFSYNDENSIQHYKYVEGMLDDFNVSNVKKLKNIFWNTDAYEELKKIINHQQIDIFHGHNIHTRLSPSIIFAAKELGVKTFITLHDLKYVCPHYSMLHNYKICEDCEGGAYYHAVLNKCHKESYIKSAIVAAELYNFERLKLHTVVDTFISPSHFLIQKYKEMGFKGRLEYIPNFIDTQANIESVEQGDNYIFVGRLSYEKGILVLLEAFKNNNKKLDIVGDGPLMNTIKEYIEKHSMSNRIMLHGHLSSKQVLQKVLISKALILPSETYENAPISILEALSFGKIVLGSNLGGIPEMIHESQNGFLFKPGSADDLNRAIDKCESLSEKELDRFKAYSLELVNTVFSKKAHLNRLIKLYEEG